MSVTLPLSSKISRTDFKKTVKARTLVGQFGDGYSQEAPDSINSIVPSYTVTWAGLNVTEKDVVETFLNSVGGWGRITWIPCYESSAQLFKLKDGTWELTVINNSTFSISCTLIKVFM
jgi:phage-related protein